MRIPAIVTYAPGVNRPGLVTETLQAYVQPTSTGGKVFAFRQTPGDLSVSPGSPKLSRTIGVTKATAADLVQPHPAETIAAKVDVFDWLTEKQDKRVAKSPAGYLVKSITDDYAPPKGFVSKAERRRQEDARQAKDRQAAEDRRRRKEEEARERADKKVIAAYWESLTPEQQAELDAAADAVAAPELMAMDEGPLKRIGQQLRRNGYIGNKVFRRFFR